MITVVSYHPQRMRINRREFTTVEAAKAWCVGMTASGWIVRREVAQPEAARLNVDVAQMPAMTGTANGREADREQKSAGILGGRCPNGKQPSALKRAPQASAEERSR